MVKALNCCAQYNFSFKNGYWYTWTNKKSVFRVRFFWSRSSYHARQTNLNALVLAVGSVTWQIHWEPSVEVKHFSLYVSYTKVLFNNQHPVRRIGRIYIVILIFRRHNTAGIISHKQFETANTAWSRFHQSCNVSLSLKARKPIKQF